jgi:DNA-directed RNA polymerase specialized sigma24 family protein
VSRGRDGEYSEYVAARLGSLRRLAGVLCDDWDRADGLVQATLTTLYVHWGRVRAATHPDAYARVVLVREFTRERRSVWVRRVSLPGTVTDRAAAAVDHDAVLDLRAAVGALPPRQRATLVLRFYCDLNVDQAAQILGCSGWYHADSVVHGHGRMVALRLRTGAVPPHRLGQRFELPRGEGADQARA